VIRDRVLKTLDDLGVQYAVVGAVAVAARGVVRSTLDFDLLTTDTRVLQDRVWAELPDVDIRKGDSDDPIAGVVRIGPKSEQIDIVVGRWKWEQRVIERAQAADVQGTILRVPLTSDLILLKLAAGGPIDQQDILRLLAVGARDQLIADVNGKISDLPDDAQQLWTRLIAPSS
jgi:hypothetical protein